MALYAFDGTWNKDKPGARNDTNVRKLAEAYQPQGQVHYIEGVGVRFGILGRIAGGITGAGGRKRVEEAWSALKKNVAKGDANIDVVGFSRGAALALEFAEWVQKKPIKGQPGPPPIRFLGLWDTVHSFGLPGNSINIGWAMSLPRNVRKCYHALALDERRHTFPLTRLSTQVPNAAGEGRLYEVWFRGVHSDVGGGNDNRGLSNIALYWMIRAGQRAGVAFDAARMEKIRDGRKPEAPISVHAFDPVKNRFRDVHWNDWVHASVQPRADGGQREHNNPPAGLTRMDDDGSITPGA